ncbi:hypothetical protein OCK74_00830 [Chitinophagaceae bacterium LB-8]|uniref:Uncharacterized protein n=1 Tax=Paraflavisolibacter caeni TaxID=2982496 RepID=A0A9X2XSB3_9BACT|nr:hypothetical protein [Paraflavisolibacter caeni]MCU7547630.1 hypothetical protein [Paraflavisolibacter caeni]
MEQVYINSKERVVIKDGKKVPRLLLGMIRGSIGKCFVVKHYGSRGEPGRGYGRQ